jgi:multiple sugar transport system substrate-binding protein
MVIWTSARWRAVTIGVGALALAAGAAACSSGSGSSSSTAAGGGSSSSAAAGPTQTIVFAESGLGTEGQQTQLAINGFEKAYPNIKVSVQVLSSNSTTYLSQLEHDFIAGSSTPDVFESDVTYPAKFAQAGWVLPLTQFKPDMSQYFSTDVAAGTYNGTYYAMPWFDNPEGLFYRLHPVPGRSGRHPRLGARRRDAGDQRQDRARRGGLAVHPVPDQPVGGDRAGDRGR